MIGHVEHGIPVPIGKRAVIGKSAAIRALLHSLSHGDSFLTDIDQRFVLNVASQCQIRIKTRTVEGGNIRVWLVAAPKSKTP